MSPHAGMLRFLVLSKYTFRSALGSHVPLEVHSAESCKRVVLYFLECTNEGPEWFNRLYWKEYMRCIPIFVHF